MSEQLAIIRKGDLRINGKSTLAELTAQISEATLVAEISKSPLLKGKAKRYVDLYLVFKNRQAPLSIRNSCAEEINQIQDNFSSERKSSALIAAIHKEEFSRDPRLMEILSA